LHSGFLEYEKEELPLDCDIWFRCPGLQTFTYELLSVQDNEHIHFSCEVKYSAEQRIQLHSTLLEHSLQEKIKTAWLYSAI
jgi:hypothetical protein